MPSLFLFSLGTDSKQFSDEGRLASSISFTHFSHVSFPEQIHDFISLKCSPCRLERKESQPWLHQSFDEAMVLFDQIVQILALPQFASSRSRELRVQ
jgi:hypothetical protein